MKRGLFGSPFCLKVKKGSAEPPLAQFESLASSYDFPGRVERYVPRVATVADARR